MSKQLKMYISFLRNLLAIKGFFGMLMWSGISKSQTVDYKPQAFWVFLGNDSRNSHHSIIQVKNKWYLFYHVQGPSPYERRVCADYFHYNKKGGIKMVRMTTKGIKPLK